MFIPPVFRQKSVKALHELIENHNFGILFSVGDDGYAVTHVPFMLERDKGPNGTLIMHVARANPHWKHFENPRGALAVFLGPHAYISPSWYLNKASVPTWNYAAVHVRGTPNLIMDKDELRWIVKALSRRHESPSSHWTLENAEAIMEKSLAAIVGIEMPIESIEGKFKFSQNLPVEDQKGVIDALIGSSDPLERGVAFIMRQNLRNTGASKASNDDEPR